MKSNRRSTGKLSTIEIVLLILFTILFWCGIFYLNGYVIEHESEVETINGLVISLEDTIFPLGLMLWGIITMMLNGLFRRN